MIERYSLTASAAKVQERFSVDVPSFYKPRYNAAPTQLLPVITSSDKKGLSLFYWGRPPQWARNRALSEKVVNLQAETLIERPVLKKALMKSRCIIPADSFYAWKKIGKKAVIPYRIMCDQELFSFAGIWEEFENEEGDMMHTFFIVTTASNATVAAIHDRMPVLLDRESENTWLSNQADEIQLIGLLVPYAADKINLYTISPGIIDSKRDAPSLIEPAQPADQYGNLTLFD